MTMMTDKNSLSFYTFAAVAWHKMIWVISSFYYIISKIHCSKFIGIGKRLGYFLHFGIIKQKGDLLIDMTTYDAQHTPYQKVKFEPSCKKCVLRKMLHIEKSIRIKQYLLCTVEVKAKPPVTFME